MNGLINHVYSENTIDGVTKTTIKFSNESAFDYVTLLSYNGDPINIDKYIDRAKHELLDLGDLNGCNKSYDKIAMHYKLDLFRLHLYKNPTSLSNIHAIIDMKRYAAYADIVDEYLKRAFLNDFTSIAGVINDSPTPQEFCPLINMVSYIPTSLETADLLHINPERAGFTKSVSNLYSLVIGGGLSDR